MRFPRTFVALGCLLATAVVPMPAAESGAGAERAVENLTAFARVYGYVRFFHPSDQAAAIDWDKFGVLGAEAVRDAADAKALREALRRLFLPVAPGLRLTPATPSPPPGTTEQVIFWQYRGINLSNVKTPYKHRRIFGAGDPAQLFSPAVAPPPLTRTIAPGLTLSLPLTLAVDAQGQTSAADAAGFATLQAELARVDLKALTPADWRLRVAGVVTVWNVFQHFHPYLDGLGIKWEETLAPTLQRTLRDRNATDYHATLSELVAKTQDGHGYVFDRPGTVGGIPWRVAMIEEKLVVTGAGEGLPFRKGDIIDRVDGSPALAILRERERTIAGSPHLRQFRALNQFGEGAVGSIARVEIRRDGAEQTVEFTRTPDRRGIFFNPIAEFGLPPFAEVRPGIFYVNLIACSAPALAEKLPQLAAARGVIFDWRYDGLTRKAYPTKAIIPDTDVISHLIDQRVRGSPMLIPQVTRPDRVAWSYRESTFAVEPRPPRFKGRIVFINEPTVVSAGETCMAVIAGHHLATLVGAATAGTNGNFNYIPLPGGFRVMWTGMDVRKNDRSPFYGVGFVPDFPVARTLRAVREGRDEYLEKAIEVIEQATPPAAPVTSKK